jgi:hypothetical protein
MGGASQVQAKPKPRFGILIASTPSGFFHKPRNDRKLLLKNADI